MSLFSRILRHEPGKTGLPPGTPIFSGTPNQDPAKITLIDYDRDHYQCQEGMNPDIFKTLAQSTSTTWLNIQGLHDVKLIQELAELFQIHALTVEDIVSPRQRSKLEIYDGYLYFVARLPEYDATTQEVKLEQISFILTKNVLITFQENENILFNPVIRRIEEGIGRIRRRKVDYLAYALLDAVVDNCFVVLSQVGEEIENLDEELLEHPQSATMHRIHRLKREMILLRKAVWPLREVISTIQHEEIIFFSTSINFYLRDLYDHTIQVIETVDTYRDIISGMLDTYLTTLGHRTNEVMKVLTIFASIFIPLTFIAGIYGMNFNTEKSPLNMPELNWYFGYPLALGLMVGVTVGMLIFFKRNKWF